MEAHGFWGILGIWCGAALTVFAFSFLYKDNPFYRFAESLFVGVSAGYGAAMVVHETFYRDIIVPVMAGFRFTSSDPAAWAMILHRLVGCTLGLMMWSRFIPRISWLSRWPMGFAIGFGTGVNIPYYIQQWLLPQIYGTVVPLTYIWTRAAEQKKQIGWGLNPELAAKMAEAVPPDGMLHWGLTISRIILFIGVLAALSYFFFSKAHKGAYGKFTRVGVYFLMISFGATFGNTVMARMALLIGRIQFLLYDWLGTMGVHLR